MKCDTYGFKRGNSFNDRTGEENINNQGLKMTIKEYRNAVDIDVEFDNGTVVNNVEYNSFKMGYTRNPNRVGITNVNKYGYKMTILEDNGSSLKIKFDNGHMSNTSFKSFMSGDVFNPMDKRVLGVGFLGFGEYKQTINNIQTESYKTWYQMIRRCYSEKQLNRNPSYEGCTVCEEWHNFQNFARWYEENYYKIDKETMALDKDILSKGNKIYSPKTCIFVPKRINSIFTSTPTKRRKFPIGVSKVNDVYRSTINKNKKNIRIGYFKTPEEAFYVYKEAKEKYIKQVADEYKDKIPTKLYEAMCNYKVEITD